MKKSYSLNIFIKIFYFLLSLLIFGGIVFIIVKGKNYYLDPNFYFGTIICLPAAFLILSGTTIRIELYENYFLFKHLHLKAKIEFKDIFDITSQIILFRWYFIRYYKGGVMVKRVLLPMHEMYDLLNELKKGSPDLILEERIKRKINELKSKGKIA